MTRRTFRGRAHGGLRGFTGRARAALVVAVVPALAACDNLSPEVSGISSHDGGSGPIVIGHFASITGDQASFGASDRNGLTLAIEERNARGGSTPVRSR